MSLFTGAWFELYSFALCSLFFFFELFFRKMALVLVRNMMTFDNPLVMKDERSHFMYFSFLDAEGATGGVL